MPDAPVPTVLARVRRSLTVGVLSVAVGVAASCGTTTTTRATAGAVPGARGEIVEGPANITAFAPEETRTRVVDVETLDLRQVFEEIGDDATIWYQHVQTLANPYFEGRVNGSDGTARARDYLAFCFRRYGLGPAFPAPGAPGGSGGQAWVSYEQPFDFSSRQRMQATVDGAHASIDDAALTPGADFVTLGISGNGDVTGPVTFVGYGIERGTDGYRSFPDDTDLTGRIALLLRYEPLDEDGASRWADTRFSIHAGLLGKLRAVEDRGAAGVILVNPPGCRDGATGLEPLERSVGFGTERSIPVIQVTPAIADRLLRTGDPQGRDLGFWRRRADVRGDTVVDLDGAVVRFGATIERERRSTLVPGANVAGVLRGHGALADEWLVVGGHYDHNGYGMFGTTPDEGPLFPGADDNASGTAGVLTLARRLAADYAEAGRDTPRRSILFIAFDAEERGLHGSRHFAAHPSIAPERMTALLNMDMVGRLRSNSLSVLGVGTAEGFAALLRPHFEASGLRVAVTASGSGRSDDANFHRIRVPGLHFFTGMHAEYTSPRDQAYTVNPIGASRILALLRDIAWDLATRRDRLTYRAPDGEADAGQDRGYAPVRLGIRPGMGADLATGILVDGVSPDTSAAAAGLEAGDVLLLWNDTELDGMGALAERLREHRPGDVVSITVERVGRRLVVPVTLRASRGRRE